MTDNIKKSLKQRSKSNKNLYKNGQRNGEHIEFNSDLIEFSCDITSLISEAKKNYILKMMSKLEDSNKTNNILVHIKSFPL